MVRSPWKPFILKRDVPIGQGLRRRRPTKLSLGCEVLGSRELLSTAAVALAVPSAATVATDAALLKAGDPAAFARFENDLAQAESRSNVTRAQASLLAQDESAIDQAIEAAGYTSSATTQGVGEVSDLIDNSFRSDPSQVVKQRVYLVSVDGRPLARKGDPSITVNVRSELDEAVNGMTGGKQLVSSTIGQMKAVSQAVELTPRLHSALAADWRTLANKVSPVAVDVYYKGQVDNFIKG
jgi:hypothetical protein